MATPEILTSDITYREERFRVGSFDEPAAAEAFEALYSSLPVASARYRILKPLLDLLIVFLALPIALPLGIFLAALIRLTSKGSVLYRHRRIGQFQQPVYVWKFRTMYEDSAHLLE
ncbi:MAG: sugar transferase, partial [Silvibacterium sp.]